MENYNINIKRLNHFCEYLEYINTPHDIPCDIPDNILDIIKNKLNEEIPTYIIVKNIMKSLKMNKYYEYIPYITNVLSGSQSKFMPKELQNELCDSYKCILKIWNNIVGSRKSMLSYSYMIHKLLEQREENNTYIQFISLEMSKEKMLICDNIWKDICNINNWIFISSFK